MTLKLAWRNIWRNWRRTVIIVTAIIIGIWGMIFLAALMRGMMDAMVRNGIMTLTGHVLIQPKAYIEDPSIVHRIKDPEAVAAALARVMPPGGRWTRRIRIEAVVSNARHSRGITLVGIDPRREAGLSFLAGAVVEGRYLCSQEPLGMMIGKGLARRFETRLGRKMIVMTTDPSGQIISRAFRVVGVFDAELESTETTYVFVPAVSIEQMLGVADAATEFCVLAPEADQADHLAAQCRRVLRGRGLSIRPWRKALPLLDATLRLYDGFVLIWFLVVCVAMGFGIVNTVLMAVFERMREFGLVRALGQRPEAIVVQILTESLLMLLGGAVIGNALALASCRALSRGGLDLSALARGAEFAGLSRVIYPAVRFSDLLSANLVVFGLGLMVSCYPALKAACVKPVDAIVHT